MRKTTNIVFILLFIMMISGITSAQDIGVTAVRDIDQILPVEQRAQVMNEILKWRLDNIVPELMRREGIDIWITICREYNEDPIYLSMVPEPTQAARRTSILIFHDKGGEGVERLTGSFYGMGKWYKSMNLRLGLLGTDYRPLLNPSWSKH